MAFRFELYLISLILFVFGVGYSDSGVSASIQVSATVEQPLGLSSISESEFEKRNFDNDISGINLYPSNQILFRIPQSKSAICIIETIDGKQNSYPVSNDLLPVTATQSEIDKYREISTITLIYTEN